MLSATLISLLLLTTSHTALAQSSSFMISFFSDTGCENFINSQLGFVNETCLADPTSGPCQDSTAHFTQVSNFSSVSVSDIALELLPTNITATVTSTLGAVAEIVNLQLTDVANCGNFDGNAFGVAANAFHVATINQIG